MSVYRCHICGDYKDSDCEGGELNPVTNEEICETCYDYLHDNIEELRNV